MKLMPNMPDEAYKHLLGYGSISNGVPVIRHSADSDREMPEPPRHSRFCGDISKDITVPNRRAR